MVPPSASDPPAPPFLTPLTPPAEPAPGGGSADAGPGETSFATMLDALPTLAWTARADGYIDWYNRRWYEYTGTTPADMEGWGWQRVHDPAVLPAVLERWRASIATGRPFEMTFPLRGADGVYRDFLTRVAPVRAGGAEEGAEGGAGRVTRWVGTNTDLTPEREAAAERERLHAATEAARAELETAYAELAAVNAQLAEQGLELELQNQQLQDQAVELEAATEELQATAAQLEEQAEAADRARAELAASEARFRSLVESGAVGLVIGDGAGRLSYVNDALLAMLGYTRADVDPALGGTPLRWDVLTPPELAHLDAAAVAELTARGRAAPYEKVYLAKDGRRVPILVGPAALGRAADGGVEIGAFVVDLTARVAAEAALATQYALLRTVLASTDDLVFAKDRDGRYLVANDAMARLTGRATGADVVGRTDAELFAPDVAAALRAHDQAVMADGATRRFEESTAVDGPGGPARVTYLSTKAALRDAAGAVLGVVGISTDITARATAEDALRASEAFARSVFEASPDCAKTLDLDGRLLTMNGPGLCLMEIDDFCLMEGADWPAFWAVGGMEAAARAAVATARAGGTARFQGFCPTAKGAGRWWDVLVSPVRGADGAVVRLLAVSRDVTEQQAAAAERERLLADAERARAEAEAANAAKSQFLANMSHELRTPLNAIGGYAELLDMGLHGPVTGDQRHALGRVQAAQRHLLGLINDILNYAKLESGRVEYDVRPVDLRAVVRDVAPLVEPQMAAKGLRFDVRLPEAACPVWADREKLAQVLVNLLSNAAKFTDGPGPSAPARGPGGVAVDVVVSLATRETGPGPGGPDAGRPDLVFLRVTDTGRGIAPDQQEAVFEPFVQVGQRFAGEHAGTGLGLAISRDLARGMGGDLRVRSAVGRGSTFTVALRRVVDAAGEPTDRRTGDERREDERRAGEDRRAGDAPE